MIPLHKQYPRLEATLSHLPFGTFPTPVEPLAGLCSRLNRSSLYIKRDDLSATPYGGNKIRKLEFLLADARKRGAVRIITSGAAGSNHALATAIYSRKYGFDCTLMLFAQPPGHGIGRQLLADFATSAELLHDATYTAHCRHLSEVVTRYTKTDGVPPYVIPAGGSSAIGVAGYVNAAFELAAQIRRGELPEPAAIYITLGTMGTVAGLLLGLTASGIKSTVAAVQVVPEAVADHRKLAILFKESNKLLHDADPSFPLIRYEQASLELKYNYLGDGYGISTPATDAAIAIFRDSDDLILDPVYTGKTAAAFLDDIVTERLHQKPVLFWNTKSAHAAPVPNPPPDYRKLPPELHTYFSG